MSDRLKNRLAQVENCRVSNSVADRLADTLPDLRGREREFVKSLAAALYRWNGRVASFGHTGVRTRRVTICMDAEKWEAERG